MSINKYVFGAVASLSLLALFSPPDVMARTTGTTTRSVYISTQPFYTDSESHVNYQWKQGSQDTYWVWRWQKFYPEFTTNCSSSSGCTSNVTKLTSEAVAYMLGTNVQGSGVYKKLTGQLQLQFQKTVTTTTSVSFAQTINLKNGESAYAGVIALDKYVPTAPIEGVWNKQSCTPISGGRGGFDCTYVWDNTEVVGTFTGHVLRQQRTFLCATKTTVTPVNGGTLPSGCVPPAIPY